MCKLSDLGLHAEVSYDRSVMLRKKSMSSSVFSDSSVADGGYGGYGGKETSPPLSRGPSRPADGNGLYGDASPFLMVSEGPIFCNQNASEYDKRMISKYAVSDAVLDSCEMCCS